MNLAQQGNYLYVALGDFFKASIFEFSKNNPNRIQQPDTREFAKHKNLLCLDYNAVDIKVMDKKTKLNHA